MRLLQFCLIGALSLASYEPVRAQTVSPKNTEVQAVVERFHAALAAGDVKGATDLLAVDAVVLEAGELESRRQYLEHHLPADIKFASSVPSKRRNLQVTQSGGVAWVTSTSSTQGVFEGKPVSLLGAELVVLSKEGNGWLIRAIHWSSRKAK